ncbi:Urb2/Npa2 family protein [Phlyctema vagabunda]|uniref:Urb2/Npa2 family protein n=1 Tax=Phlyctema vagabunda TaxID=108571 RepID=A0ABR4PXZ9_9HELO
MASQSRAAQERLVQLEKDSAPFNDQLAEAAKFVGEDIDHVGRDSSSEEYLSGTAKVALLHGREEWLLRWLVKKLQAPKDDIPRKTPASWRLLKHVLQIIPLPNAARVLNERKFMTILQQTLEIAKKELETRSATEVTVESSSANKKPKTSKKRKHTGELVVQDGQNASDGSMELPYALSDVMSTILHLTKEGNTNSNEGSFNSFSAEYMKSVIRTSAEESAKILGLWLSVSSVVVGSLGQTDNSKAKGWLQPFVTAWELHTPSSDSTAQFSLHTTRPLLSLLGSSQTAQLSEYGWIVELEELVARNIILPAKAAASDVPVPDKDAKHSEYTPDILRDLTRASILFDPANASILFGIAIRSLQPHGVRRRRAQDETWLQKVFATMVEPMPSQRTPTSAKALGDMIQSAIDHKVSLDLSTLRSITSTLTFSGKAELFDWILLAKVIDLDANVLLIPNEDADLLSLVLGKLTTAPFSSSWQLIQYQVLDNVLVPLIKEFSRARDLTGFIKHWYAQLVESERQRSEQELDVFSVWEEETLQSEFSKLLEASLTLQQILQVLDWLELEVKENAAAALVILEAIVGSITREEIVDAVGLRPYEIMFESTSGKKVISELDERFRWRCWRVISRTLRWANDSTMNRFSAMWSKKSSPFSLLQKTTFEGDLIRTKSEKTLGGLEELEKFRCVCAVWAVGQCHERFKDAIRPTMTGLLTRLGLDTKRLRKDLYKSKAQNMGDDIRNSTDPTLARGYGWMIWSCLRFVTVEYPAVLGLYAGLKKEFKDLILCIIYAASCSDGLLGISTPWFTTNGPAFLQLWKSIIQNDYIHNQPEIIGQLIDILQSGDTTLPVQGDTGSVALFAAQGLLELPLEVFSRKQREFIMTDWLQNDNTKSSTEQASFPPTHPVVLALRGKFLRRFPTYEVGNLTTRKLNYETNRDQGMSFQDLVHLGNGLSSQSRFPKVTLSIFAEIARLVLSHAMANLEQPPSRKYVSDAVQYLQEVKGEKRSPYVLTKLVEVLLKSLSTKTDSLAELDIITAAEFAETKKTFSKTLQHRLKKSLGSGILADDDTIESLEMLCTLDALKSAGVDGAKFSKIIKNLDDLNLSKSSKLSTGKRLKVFTATYVPEVAEQILEVEQENDINSLSGRMAIHDQAIALTHGKDEKEKLQLLQKIIGDDQKGLEQLDTLLTARHIISACEDSRATNDSDAGFNLSMAYSALSSQLLKTTSIRKLCLIIETMEMMLRLKGRALSQWNIDSTIGSVSILCSPSSPALSPLHSGTIYLHLCLLLRAILNSHRLKLQGHFHLVVQVMQALLRCLFTPLPHTNNKILRSHAAPPWLLPSHPLTSTHASAYTRLVTLICDPSVSSVTRFQHSSLSSATDKAKKMAGQHMQFLLMTYIKLQLEMRMAPPVREKMVPGLYAVFDTTTPELRRCISDGLDSSGRSVFGMLFRDWQQFGKWKGS